MLSSCTPPFPDSPPRFAGGVVVFSVHQGLYNAQQLREC